MISLKSLIMFTIINGGLLSMSALHYLIVTNKKLSLLIKLLSFILKNIILVKLMNYLVYKNNKTNKPKENFCLEHQIHLIVASVIEFITFLLLNIQDKHQIIKDLMLFMPVSFVFEVIFDFFHYWIHRILHSNSYFYQILHKTHHTHIEVTPIITFVQNPIDLILSNAVPAYITIEIIKKLGIDIDLFTLMCILTYKSYIEVAGHSDIKAKKTGSFVQCIWLTRYLDITLLSQHHVMHHTHVTKNFSKRFSLWDKVFGTFKNH